MRCSRTSRRPDHQEGLFALSSPLLLFFSFPFRRSSPADRLVLQIEVSDPSEITENSLHEEIHPPEVEQKQGFQRPSRPGRGRARVTRS